MNTSKRRDNGGTEFTNWIRKQPELSSQYGYRGTDVDLVWCREIEKNGSGLIMFLEEKTFEHYPKYNQLRMFRSLDSVLIDNWSRYRGFHLIRFQKSNPEDGMIWIDERMVEKDFFMKFLKFEVEDEWYLSFFQKLLLKGHNWEIYTEK